ncbi:MAG TPA: DUF6498-containing protein [Candidatus Saccharimonadia bacterium]|nr:DUF6498-containing protein [Candidatus Saccharimonadia bacterium]
MGPRFVRRDWRTLLRDFPKRPGAWRVLATNLVPLAGVLLLGWLAGIATLSFFLDALLSAATLAFVMTVHAMDEMSHVRGVSRYLGIVFLWTAIMPFIALPVFVGGLFAFGFAGLSLDEAWRVLRFDWTVQAGFAALAVGHAGTAFQWLRRHDRRAVRDELREAFGLMVFRVLVLAMLGANVGVVFLVLGWYGQLLLLAVIAVILTVAEVYRAEVLEVMGVDRKFHDSCEPATPVAEPAKRAKDARRAERRGRGAERDA